MMERSKTASAHAPEEENKKTTAVVVADPSPPFSAVAGVGGSSAEQIRDLERRLKYLDGGDVAASAAPPQASSTASASAAANNNPLLVSPFRSVSVARFGWSGCLWEGRRSRMKGAGRAW